MPQVKAVYINKEEINKFLEYISNDSELSDMINFIYYDGLKLQEALIKIGNLFSWRYYEKKLKELSNGKIRFMDLRYSYFINNPEVWYEITIRKNKVYNLSKN
jgi:hypothetical protein